MQYIAFFNLLLFFYFLPHILSTIKYRKIYNKQYITVDNSSTLLYTVYRKKTYILRRGGGEYKENEYNRGSHIDAADL